MQLFRRAVAQLGVGRESIANQLEQRQEASATPTSVSSASPAPTATSAAAASTISVKASISSKADPSAAASATPSPNDAGDHTVTIFISTPDFTATRTTAYTAPGINATDTKTGTSTYSAASYLATANSTAPGIPDNELTACRTNGTSPDNGPFCSPIHLQSLWIGYTYAITWNPSLLDSNVSDAIIIRYDDESQGDNLNSTLLNPGAGYLNLYMDEKWLNGRAGNDSTSGQNMTLYLQSDPVNAPGNLTKGPTISLVVNPSTLPRVRIPRLPNRLGLEIGLPIGVAAALIIILALWCGSKRHNRSWRDVRGHGKEYMARRARRRGRAAKEGAIQLESYGSPRGQDAFSDEPYIGGSGNAFRDEIAKQRAEDDRFRPTIYSY